MSEKQLANRYYSNQWRAIQNITVQLAYGKILNGTPAAANSGMPTPTDVLQN
jgi:hypothetical protein